jgi:hypothetical protein
MPEEKCPYLFFRRFRLLLHRTEAMNGFAMITKDELIQWAASQGWKLDRWGRLQKEFDNGAHRNQGETEP